MKIYTWEDPIRFITQVAFISGEGSAIKLAFNFATKEEFVIKDGENLPAGCLMEIPRAVFNEMLKGFAEMANEHGLKLDSDLKREGKLEATERHLEDLRTLVFKLPRRKS